MNRQKIAILTDSCADVPAHMAKTEPIFIVPLKITYSEGSYSDGVDITARQVYQRLPAEIPKTSLPDGATITQALQQIKDEGYEKVLAIIFSSGLSGTYQMVELIGEEFPGLEVAAFDTKSGSLGTGATVLQAAEYLRQGKTWEELLSLIPRLIKNTTVFFSVDTLEYLQKGGRIGRITWVAGTMLNIKPILTFAPSGELTSIAKVRGRKASIERLCDLVYEKYTPGSRVNIMTAHGDAPQDGELVKKVLLSRIPAFVHHYESEIDCTLGVYVGPHLLGAGIQILEEDM